MHFSIVIPTCGRDKQLLRLLDQFSKINYPRNKFEIIIVDNSSDNTTFDLDNTWSNKKLLQIYVVKETRQGPSYARNTGLQRAKYMHVIFIDDDMTVQIQILNYYRKLFLKYPDATLIGGHIGICLKQDNTHFIRRVPQRFWWVWGYQFLGTRERFLTVGEELITANVALNKKKAPKFKFDEHLGRKYKKILLFGEDIEASCQLHIAQKKLLYSPLLRSINHPDKRKFSYIYLFFRHFVSGAERYIMLRELKRKFSNDDFVIRLEQDLFHYFSFHDICKESVTHKSWLLLITHVCAFIGFKANKLLISTHI